MQLKCLDLMALNWLIAQVTHRLYAVASVLTQSILIKSNRLLVPITVTMYVAPLEHFHMVSYVSVCCTIGTYIAKMILVHIYICTTLCGRIKGKNRDTSDILP